MRPKELAIPKMSATEEVDEEGQIIKVQDMTEEINSAKFHLYKYSTKWNLAQIMKYQSLKPVLVPKVKEEEPTKERGC